MKKLFSLFLLLGMMACAAAATGIDKFKDDYAGDPSVKKAAREFLDQYLADRKSGKNVETKFNTYTGAIVNVLDYKFVNCGYNLMEEPACFYKVQVGSEGGVTVWNTYAISFYRPEAGAAKQFEIVNIYDVNRPRQAMRQ